MKRIIDLLLILLSAPVWVPVFIILWVVVQVCFGAPAFFRQERSGLNGKPFHILKFRTMNNARDESGSLLADEERLTPCGKRLRSLSLDEIPELFNVIKGEMSLVGPRPLPTVYEGRYSADQARRLSCVPGITGWAQVNGRNLLDWEARFQHDVWYVDNRSLVLDIKILWMTVLTVFRREGISAKNSATMTEFMGSQERPDQGSVPGKDLPGSPDPFHRSES